jgi:hypothetical protein
LSKSYAGIETVDEVVAAKFGVNPEDLQEQGRSVETGKKNREEDKK